MTRTSSLFTKRAYSVALVLMLLATVFAQAQNSKIPYGRIVVSTNPGGYPILVDGKPAGETTPFARDIDLPPGRHNVEILFPNGTRWARDFNIVAGRRDCISLNFTPRTISVPRPPASPCPYPVNLSAPASVTDGDSVTFTADVGYGGPSALNYTWTVSPPAARITSGAGTPTITVDSSGLGNRRVTAILVIDDGSGDRNCRQTAQATTTVIALALPPIQPQRFDEFPSVAFDDDKARLDNLAIELQNRPGSQGHIIVYAGRGSRAGQAAKLGERSRDYLVRTRGIDSSRITVVDGGRRERDTIEIWIVPQGATPPTPTPSAATTPLPAEPPRRSNS